MRSFSHLLLGTCLLCLAACGGKKSGPIRIPADEGLTNIAPVVESAPYASVLKGCVMVEETTESCTLNQLPTLGMENANPTIDDIMERALVSHAWMATRFRQVLEEMPVEMFPLFGALTAVVIDDDIRPSYYDPLTGAIYLDPYGLWFTEEELSVINLKEDYRGEYIRQMNYRPIWRYTSPDVDFDVRDLRTISIDMAQLLFHELAHANDLFPPSSYASVDRSQRIYAVIESLESVFPSTLLKTQYPLASAEMTRLSSILYRGETATATERAITAAQVGGYFEPDRANDDYAYTSQYEDLAMLFEEFMMKVFFDLDRDVAFVTAADSPFCDDYKIGWGMRNRLGVPAVKERAQWVVEQLMPDSDYSDLFAAFPEPSTLPAGVGWCASETNLTASFEKSLQIPTYHKLVDPRHFLRPSDLQLGL